MTFDQLLATDAPLSALAEALDALTHEQRVTATRALGRAQQRRLFERADPAITLAHFVPADLPALTSVRHEGGNTLPLPPPHKRFAKVFCRPAGDDTRLFGHNDAPSSRLLGPGYFVARPTAGNPDWERRGAIVVDYWLVPDGPVPQGWPRVVPNEKGLQFFVYRHTRDFMRRVSKDVAIGAAWRGERALDHYFTLVRG